MKHTPGPWQIGMPNQVLSTARSVLAVTDCEPHIPEEETRANARLIAAAPGLLQALYEIDNLAVHHVKGAIGRAQGIARRAIRKAEGR